MLCAKFGWNWPSGSGGKSFAISLLSPLGKRSYPSFKQILVPFTQGCFVPSLAKIGPMVLGNMIAGKVFLLLSPLERI